MRPAVARPLELVAVAGLGKGGAIRRITGLELPPVAPRGLRDVEPVADPREEGGRHLVAQRDLALSKYVSFAFVEKGTVVAKPTNHERWRIRHPGER